MEVISRYQEVYLWLEALAEAKYAVDHNEISSGVRYGCDCGCGGDSISSSSWDAMVAEEDDFNELRSNVLAINIFTEDELDSICDAFDNVEEQPNEDSEWYDKELYSNGGNYDHDLEYWMAEVEQNAPIIADAMLRMMDVDLDSLEAEGYV